MAIAELRREYQTGELDRQDLIPDPIAQFQKWFNHAAATQSGSRWRKIGIALFKLWQAVLGRAPADVNAMVLATTTCDGEPSARTVLLKGVDPRGFIFFTNYESRKGRELTENPQAALVFYWPELERQVCVAGTVTRLPVAESEAYFHSRPRGSQIGAWASDQSTVVAHRKILEQQWEEIRAKYPGPVPRPPHWGGFVLSPTRLEFWQGRASRLHDRFCYRKQSAGDWTIERLAP